MLPLLYKSNTAKEDFSNNGLGFIRNCTKCKVTEVRNGMYELELEMLTNDRLANNIAVGMFLKVQANPHDSLQIFEIYQMSVTDTTITAKAQHVKYIAGGNVIDAILAPQKLTPLETWNYIKPDLYLENLFDFYSDITTKSTVTAGKDCHIRLGDFLIGSNGSMLDTFGGEFHYDNFKIELLKNRGSETGIALRYGSNISTYKQESDYSTIYSHLLPYAMVDTEFYTGENSRKNAGKTFVYGDLIDLHNNNLTYKRAVAYDFSDEFNDEEDVLIEYESGGYENAATITKKLKEVANRYVEKNKTALTEISVNITVDVAETLKNLENCKLCDTIKVYFEPLGISATAKIVKTEYDVLAEKYTKIELGTIKKTIADLFSGRNIGGV